MKIFADHTELSQAAADLLEHTLADAVRARGRALLCLCGGSTPPQTYARLAQADLPWSDVHVFWGDERWQGEEGNHHETTGPLFARAHLHPFDLGAADPQAAARHYHDHLTEFFEGGPPQFDVAVQGLGADGHTASLFPDTPALHVREAWAAAHYVPFKGRWRLTLTYPALQAARQLLFLVSGPEKREALAAVRAGADLPATALVALPQSLVYADAAAAR